MGGSGMVRLRAEKDFCTGLFCVVLAGAFLWFGRDYKLGTTALMGPGYFPTVLAWVLAALGTASVLRAFVSDGEHVGAVSWRPLILVTVAGAAFGFLIGEAGLVIALTALVVLSALASRQSVYDFKGFVVLAGLVLFCALVFVKGLGVPMPIFGSWFDGIVPPSWQR